MKSQLAARLSQSPLRRAAAALQGPLLVALAYFLGAEMAFFIGTLSDQIFALFWPPNVVLFCALLIVPQRDWWRYIAAAFAAHVISALGGAFVPIVGGGPLADYWIFWSHWYLANALPNLTLGPVFLIWFSDRASWTRWTLARTHIEPAVLGMLLIGVCVIAAAAGARLTSSSLLPAVLFLPLPLVLWAAIRFGEKGASGAILIVAVILTWRTLHGRGLFPDIDPERGVLALQMFLTGLSIPVLLLGALIDELRGAERTTLALAASLVRAQDEERRRIARDLHDSTGQNLIAAT